MTYTVDDTMKKLLSAPEAVAVLERFFPKILKNPALQMTAAMTPVSYTHLTLPTTSRV